MKRRSPAMTHEECLAADTVVAVALRPRSGEESLRDAAERIMRSPKGDRAWRVASALLSSDDSWTALRRAAKAARRLLRSAP